MARKLFISILGASVYETCRYVQGNFHSTETRFIQQATLELIGKKEPWTEQDRICILLTDRAQHSNWDKAIAERIDSHTKANIPYEGLESTLQRMGLPTQVAPIPIPDGKNEEEMWKIFQTAFDLMEEGDEVYFDLTHSFRYLSMLILVLGNYAKFLKNVHIAHISYGNYEARTDMGAPIVDLLPLTMLQDWTFAAADFLQNGYVEKMSELASNSIKILQRNEATRTEANKRLADFVSSLKSLVDERQTCRGMHISEGDTLDDLRVRSEKIEAIVIKPLEPIIKKVVATMPVSGDSLTNCLHAAQWCYDNHLYQQAVTILQEGVVTFFCERHGIRKDNEAERGIVNSAFVIKFKVLPPALWVVKDADKEKLIEMLHDVLIEQPIVYQTFDTLSKVRNDYNHSGYRSNPKPLKTKSIKDNIAKALNNFSICLTREYEEQANQRSTFVNLSNHPSDKWDETQLTAARQYGEIKDLPFPDISVDLDNKKLDKLVEKTLGKIYQTAYPAREITIHIMGEMTFTFRLVEKLKAAGIRCVASTSERVVQELSDGRKVVQFSFVRFREY